MTKEEKRRYQNQTNIGAENRKTHYSGLGMLSVWTIPDYQQKHWKPC